MRPYSKDLRVLFVRYLDGGMSARAAGAMVGVSAATGVRWGRRWRKLGDVSCGKMGGAKPCLLSGERDWLIEQVEQNRNLTLHELLETLRTERGVVVCCAGSRGLSEISCEGLHAAICGDIA